MNVHFCLQRTRHFFLFLLVLPLTTHVYGAKVVSVIKLIDDIDECLYETSFLFKGQHETSASTSSYFQDEFPQFLSVVNHHIEFTAQYFDGYSKTYTSPSSGSAESPYRPFHFTSQCSNIGGMTQTHDLSIKCKWKDNGDELTLHIPESPICISRKCNTSILREQLSVILARQVQQYLNQQINSEKVHCRVPSNACISGTKGTQNVVFLRSSSDDDYYHDDDRYAKSKHNVSPGLYDTIKLGLGLDNCNDDVDRYCFRATKKDEIECEQKGGQLIIHKLQINYSGDSDSPHGRKQNDNKHSFVVLDYPHCISRICEIGRDAEEIEKLFTETLKSSAQDAIGNLSKFDLSLKILNDDVVDYYNEPNIDDYETRSNRQSQSSTKPHRQSSAWKSTIKNFFAGVISTTCAILVYLNCFNSIKATYRRYNSPEVVPPSCEMA